MTQELKVTTSNFGADAQKGPVVIAAVGKSGGQKFHGQLYFYGRDSILNANDALNNAQGRDASGNPLAPKPATKYLYPGGNIGGPVIIPHTNFNKNHDEAVLLLRLRILRTDCRQAAFTRRPYRRPTCVNAATSARLSSRR